MENQIILQGISVNELVDLIAEKVKVKIEDFIKEADKKNFDEDLISRIEACELLKINYTTLWRWQKEERINVYKFCKKSYYKRSELLSSMIKLKV